MGNGTKPIGAVERTFEIIEALDRLGSAGTSTIARELGVSKSTTYTHLNTLHNIGYVVKTGDKYRLGCRFLRLGSNIQNDIKLYQQAKDKVQILAGETDERANLVIEEDGMGTCIYATDAKGLRDTHMKPGERYHMHVTGTGKAILSHLPKDRIDAIIAKQGLPKYTENTITTRRELNEELTQIREKGISFDDEEAIDGLCCIAVPILLDGDPKGAMSVSGPSQRFNQPEQKAELVEAVREAANEVQLNFVFS